MIIIIIIITTTIIIIIGAGIIIGTCALKPAGLCKYLWNYLITIIYRFCYEHTQDPTEGTCTTHKDMRNAREAAVG
jgi:hypothetical protein